MDTGKQKITDILAGVTDPEVPVLTVADLGIVREIRFNGDEVEIVITPTYSGCPAMDMIATNIKLALMAHGYKKIKVTSVLSPVWTTDWMSEEGKQKLKEYGIAAPVGKSFTAAYLEDIVVECPRCNSTDTRLISQFGSTACKALFQCNDCKEPFDYFKCH